MILLVLQLLFGNFVQKWYFPRGVNHGETAIMQIVDTDRDANLELIFTVYEVGPPYLHFYELHLPDIWEVDSVLLPYYHGLYGSGDFDLDGFYDLVMMFHSENPSLADGIMIYESPDSLSYPTQEVWRDTVGSPLVTPICVYDIDKDSLPEIVKVLGDYIHLHIYESVGDNLYDKIEEITTASTHNSSSTLAFGDFDTDNNNEFVWGYSGGEYSIWECIGNNSYQEITLQQLPTANIRDCFSIPDADGDGKLEFVVKGFTADARVHAFIFEATGDNSYEIIDSLDLFGGSNDYYGGYSDAGDVDGDSIPEIVLEACQNIYLIKAAGNDSFYVWDYIYGNSSGSSVRVYDIDGNGLSEVVISGNNQTRIYEYEVGITETTNASVQGLNLDIHPNPFIHALNIKLRSPTNKKVAVRVYDVNGRIVKYFNLESSIQDQESSGVWYGDDNTGKALPPGVYFVRLVMSPVGETRGYQITGKVILLR